MAVIKRGSKMGWRFIYVRSLQYFISTTGVKGLPEALVSSLSIGVVLCVVVIALVVFKYKRGKTITYNINKMVRSYIRFKV